MKKSKKFISVVLSLICVFVAFCGCNTKTEAEELLYDGSFEQGFRILGIDASVDGNTAYGYIDYGSGNKSAILWRLAQWGTKYDLGESLNGEKRENGFYIYSNAGKEVAINKGNGEIHLAVNGSKEYSAPRKNGEAWPHLLIDQEINSTVRLNDYKKITAEIEFEIPYVENKMSASDYNKLLHTAQFQWIFSVTNRNPSTAGLKNDYFWFNLSYYDYRDGQTETGGFFDGGKEDSTSKYIYSLGSANFDTEVKLATRLKISVDILPYIKNAFAEAQEKGAMKGSLYEELGLGYTNIGWEVPGTFDCQVKIYSLSLKGEK